MVLFCTVLAVFTVLFFTLPDRTFSQKENRALAQMPKPEYEAIVAGDFAAEVNRYYADQFPLRDRFVELKSATELLLLKGENHGVLYSKNQLAVRSFNAYASRIRITEDTDRIYFDSIQAQLEAVDTFAETSGIPVVVTIPPRTVDVADSLYAYDRPDGDELFLRMETALEEHCQYVNLLSLLRGKLEKGEYVYYRTDHHWTTLGAYYGYCEIMRAFGRANEITPLEEYEIEQITDFSGTTASKGCFPVYERDTLELWHLPDDGAYSVIADGAELGGFYAREHLDTADKYAVFLDGTHNITTITKPGEDRPTILVAKDSFANCLIPFLARSFDIVAVNLRSNTDLSALAEQYTVDGILIVYNTENLITCGDLGNLR